MNYVESESDGAVTIATLRRGKVNAINERVVEFFCFRRQGILDLPIPLGKSGEPDEDQRREERSEL